jgi:hypothetical protein
MTGLGKLLVFANVALSLVFLALAVGTYTNRLNWFSYQKEGGEKVIGKVQQLQDRVNELVKARDPAEARYYLATNQLAYLESERDQRTRWYAEQLAAVQSGADPVYELALPGGLDPTGKLVVPNKAERKAVVVQGMTMDGKVDNLPTQTITTYREQVANRQFTLDGLIKQTDALVAEHKKLTEIIAAPKTGLRDQINVQLGFQAEARSELNYLAPLLTNRTAEALLLLQRTEQLRKRLAELQAAGLAEK